MAVTIKKLREDAGAIKEINSKEELLHALGILLKMQELNKVNESILNRCKKIAGDLSELCTAYAASHQEVFDGGSMIRNQNGVHVGDITEGSSIYHLACGFKGYIRSNGEKLTQDFLDALPKGWKKSSLSLDVTGINTAVDKGADPATYGLIDKPNNKWSVKEA